MPASYKLEDLNKSHAHFPRELRWSLIQTHLQNQGLTVRHVTEAYETRVPIPTIMETAGLSKFNLYFLLDQEGIPRLHKHKTRTDHVAHISIPQIPGPFSGMHKPKSQRPPTPPGNDPGTSVHPRIGVGDILNHPAARAILVLGLCAGLLVLLELTT